LSHEPSERRELSAQDVLLVHRFDERDQLPLPIARGARGDVHQAVGVGADEVQGALREPFADKLSTDRCPPTPRHPCVPGVRAAEHAYAQRHPSLGDQPQAFPEPFAPGIAEPDPIISAAAEQPRAFVRRELFFPRQAGSSLANADLVPLDLEGHERRDEIVDIGCAGQQHGERAGPVVVPPSPARGRLGFLP
jgi:hypothetical protein